MILLAITVPLVVLGFAQAAPDYVLEGYFIVEPQVLRNYMKLGYDRHAAETNVTADVDVLINEVNKYFQSMYSDGLSIEVRRTHLLIMSEELFEDCKLVGGDKLQVDLALAVIKDYIKKTDASNQKVYDMVIVLTGYDLFGGNNGHSTTGYAPISQACKHPHNVVISEYFGTQVAASITAHEIAHNLGAEHDGSPSCKQMDMDYIMSPSTRARSKNRWSFSGCSAAQIKNYISSLDESGENCLKKTTTPVVTFDLASQIERDIFKPQKICQRAMLNESSYFCHSLYSTGKEEVCQILFCARTGTLRCRGATPTEGMACDVNKRCNKGKCVTAPKDLPTPPSVKTGCVFGDTNSMGTWTDHKTCEDYLQTEGISKCRSTWFNKRCCASCAARRFSIPDCPYGDYPFCDKYTARQVCGLSNQRRMCCYKCRNYRDKRSDIGQAFILPPLLKDPFEFEDDQEVAVIEDDTKLMQPILALP